MLGRVQAFLMFPSAPKFPKVLVLTNLYVFPHHYPAFKIFARAKCLGATFSVRIPNQGSVFISKIPYSKVSFPIVLVPATILSYDCPSCMCKAVFVLPEHVAQCWHGLQENF